MGVIMSLWSWIKAKFKKSKPVEKTEDTQKQELPKNPNERGSLKWYGHNFDTANINPKYQTVAEKAAKTVLAGKARYEPVAEHFGIPWWVLGCIHYKEASCNFSGVLHNGEKIIGTGKKTKIVPKGRGPFSSWEEAAVDAIKFDALDKKILKNGSSLEGILKALEAYNGMGYFNHHPDQLTCYLWACTTINKPFGRYTSDGKYDYNADANSHCGIVPILKVLEAQGHVDFKRLEA